MKTLLLSAMLLMQPSCCAKPPVSPHPDKCTVPVIPSPPELHPSSCGESVCLTVEDTIALSRWIGLVGDTREALAGCSLVKP